MVWDDARMGPDELVVAWAGVVATLLGAGLVFYGLVDAANARKEQNSILKKTETLRMLVETIHQRSSSQLGLPVDSDREAIAQKIQVAMGTGADGAEARAQVRQYLNYWETVAGGVSSGVLDENLLHTQARTRVVSLWENYYPYIADRRRNRNAPTLWVELEQLATKWGASPTELMPTDPTAEVAAPEAGERLGEEKSTSTNR